MLAAAGDPRAVVVHDHDLVERFEVLDQQRRIVALDPADDHLTTRSAVDESRDEMGPYQRTGHQRAAELLEDEHRVGPTQLDATIALR